MAVPKDGCESYACHMPDNRQLADIMTDRTSYTTVPPPIILIINHDFLSRTTPVEMRSGDCPFGRRLGD